jgi:predicted lipid-binding transport protein (Tim44 family)
MTMTGMKFRGFSLIALSVATFAMMATPADARRGGSFGSRGARTADAPPTTATAPNQAAPVQRSMTERPATPNTAQNPSAANNARPNAAAPNKFGGMAKGLLGGLVAGGLIAMLLGGGFGALAGSGMVTALLQIALIGGVIWLALRLFRRRPMMASAGAPAVSNISPFSQDFSGAARPMDSGKTTQNLGFAQARVQNLAITMADKGDFERLLSEVQDAFSREDYAALRACTTPEVMSYLAEELSQNATQGLRNDVSQTELLEAEIAEAWSEGDTDYATVAMQYHSIDILRDRTSGAIVRGDPAKPTRTTELWTFVRDTQNPWRLSAIQEA